MLSTPVRIRIGAFRHRLEMMAWDHAPTARRLLRSDVAALLRTTDNTRTSLEHLERSHWSQNGEDGIIRYLTDSLGIEAGEFVEIGASDGEENCTRALVEAGWSGFWVEGDPELAIGARRVIGSRPVIVEAAYVDRSNIIELLTSNNVSPEPDVFVIDIDGADLDVLEVALRQVRPKVIVHEYNSEHRYPWKMGPRTGPWQRDWNYGASLAAFAHLLGGAGYDLIGVTSSGVNAFWVEQGVRPAGVATSSPSQAYRSGDHRPGSVGHPRRSFVHPRTDHPVDLGALKMTDVELIGIQSRPDEARGWLLANLANHSPTSISSGGGLPVHLAYSVSSEPHGRTEPTAMTTEPTRSILAHPLMPGQRRPVLVEFHLEPHADCWVMPFAVQESIGWSEPLLDEPILVRRAATPTTSQDV